MVDTTELTQHSQSCIVKLYRRITFATKCMVVMVLQEIAQETGEKILGHMMMEVD